MQTLTNQVVSQMAMLACVLEASAPKPGNVNKKHDFHDACYEEFMASAIAIGPCLAQAQEKCVGQIILDAVKATRQVVNSNINLGIILLLAPLCKAALIDKGLGLKKSLALVLQDLTTEDARLAYKAINLAKPSGMGQVQDQDLATSPENVTFLEAMDLAKERDLIAREYTTCFEITFDQALYTLNRIWQEGLGLKQAVLRSFLHVLSNNPDTLIARKAGMEKAVEVSQKAKQALKLGAWATKQGNNALEELDSYLRDEGHKMNPGTTADIMAAAIFVFLIQDRMRNQLPRILRSW